MGFRIKCKCRGEAKYYVLIESLVSPEKLFLQALSPNGEELPARIVVVGASSLVVVLMGFEISQEVKLLDASGRCVFSFRVHPLSFALGSKINGVIRKRECQEIRNIDGSGVACLASVLFDAFVPTADGFLIRCRLSNCEDIGASSIVAMDKNGLTIGRGLRIARDSSLGWSGKENAFFSIEVPSLEEAPLCLCAVDEEGKPIGAFFGLEKKDVARQLELCKEAHSTAFDDCRYTEWLSCMRVTAAESEVQKMTRFDRSPLFSIIVPLYKTPLDFFRDMVDSVLSQTYRKWELVLVNSTPDDVELARLVGRYACADPRIKVLELERNYGITENTNYGVKEAKGDYLCFFDHDDVLEPDILFEYAKTINEFGDVDLLYCDEDKLFPDGSLRNPTFKPDFSLDMLRDNNYVCHLMTVRSDILARIGISSSDLDGAQDHAMVLKVAELGGRICHVPKLLYHWRVSDNSTAGNADSKPYANIAGVKAVQEHLDRVEIPARVSLSHGRSFRYSPDYEVPSGTHVSVVVPTRGNADTVNDFLNGLSSTSFDNWEILFVCSGVAKHLIEEAAKDFPLEVSILSTDSPFNYSAWANEGARRASGDVLVFAHDDIRPADRNWLHVLTGFACREDVGVVGTMSCDLDGVIQQAGLSFLDDEILSLSRGFHSSSAGYIFLSSTVRDVAAVSGVCLASSRIAFETVGGFDESYGLDYADVDYCFAAERRGLKVVYTPEAKMYHKSNTNRYLLNRSRSSAHFSDKALLLGKWSHRFAQGDRFFNPSFSRNKEEAESYKLARPELGIG